MVGVGRGPGGTGLCSREHMEGALRLPIFCRIHGLPGRWLQPERYWDDALRSSVLARFPDPAIRITLDARRHFAVVTASEEIVESSQVEFPSDIPRTARRLELAPQVVPALETRPAFGHSDAPSIPTHNQVCLPAHCQLRRHQ
jgi:hypothetical protein